MAGRALAVVLLVALVGACGGDDSTSIEPADEPASTPAGLACLDPRAAQDRPEGGWLAADGHVVDGLPAELKVLERSAGLDALAEVVAADLPTGFTVTDRRETTGDECAIRRVVIARGDAGAFVFVAVEQLRGRRSLFSIPLSGQLDQRSAADGTETVHDDFNADGVRRTVLFVTEDGLFVEAVAAGAHAPDLSGWPTTTAPPQGEQPPPEEAPRTIDELDRLARAVASRTRQAG